MRLDLCYFEGNAQAIRMAHSLLKLNLTYAQVGCILKYTRPAYWQGPGPAAFSYLMNKHGFYLAEEEYVQTLRRELSLGEFHRFPLTYIMEAADDISYCIAGLEDSVEKNLYRGTIVPFLQKEWGSVVKGDLFEKVISQAFNKIRRYQGLHSCDQFFMYLRVNTVARLVPHAAQRFLDNLAPIYDGRFNQALLEDSSPAFRLLKIFKSVAFKHVFNHPEVEQLELQGYRVISGLLEIYNPLLEMSPADFQRLVTEDYHPAHPIASRLYHKLSAKHRLAYGEAMEAVNRYPAGQQSMMEFSYRARLIQDYISGMTDLYAWDEYRRLMAAE
ncbi:dGTPase [Sodalis-like symbiont of Bactericera trigonica]|nr:dGTPase [Sodalis-like symbiont of Bactericera trigonica]